jgi:hypothetical protein
MPSWKAAAILMSWASLFILVAMSSLVATCTGIALWGKYRVRCPGMILAIGAVLLVMALSLPLIG